MKIAICRLAYGGWHHAELADWLAVSCHAIVSQQIQLESFWISRAPVYAARNLAVKTAVDRGCTHLVMVDADVIPHGGFLRDAITAMHLHQPAVVAAPTLRSDGMVCVHKDTTDLDGTRHLRLWLLGELDDTNKPDASVPACGLSCCLIDLACLAALQKPYFGFVYDDDGCEVVAGEDVRFTAQLAERGHGVRILWDRWAKHYKQIELVDRWVRS